MSLTNPKNVITEERLAEFYTAILPYLGGTAHAGFTPVGTIIAVMGNTAPANYLACDGSVVNISDYIELANYFNEQFGSKNYFGGDGTTTFAVPDLRGEFLRGTGTNSHENQGNGANVGVHQDGTIHTNVFEHSSNSGDVVQINSTGFGPYHLDDVDFVYDRTFYVQSSASKYTSGTSNNGSYTSRPTNTSVLYCIATKNIYIDANSSNSNTTINYSFTQQEIGTWVNGATLYQQSFSPYYGYTVYDSSYSNPSTDANSIPGNGYLRINPDLPTGAHIRNTICRKYKWFDIYDIDGKIEIKNTNSNAQSFNSSSDFIVTLQYTIGD